MTKKKETIPSVDKNVEQLELIPFGGSDICSKHFGKLLAVANQIHPDDSISMAGYTLNRNVNICSSKDTDENAHSCIAHFRQ